MKLKGGSQNIKGLNSPVRSAIRTPSLIQFRSSLILRASNAVGSDLKKQRTTRPTSAKGSLRQAHSGLMGFVKGLS